MSTRAHVASRLGVAVCCLVFLFLEPRELACQKSKKKKQRDRQLDGFRKGVRANILPQLIMGSEFASGFASHKLSTP